MADGNLTPRQAQVLEMHDSGMKNVEIAEALGIAAGTVSNALTTALRNSGRESEVGGNGGGGSRSPMATDIEDKFRREALREIAKAESLAEQFDSYPVTFDQWVETNRESLEKDYAAKRDLLEKQVATAEEQAEKARGFAERLGIDLTAEVEDDGEPEGDDEEGEEETE